MRVSRFTRIIRIILLAGILLLAGLFCALAEETGNSSDTGTNVSGEESGEGTGTEIGTEAGTESETEAGTESETEAGTESETEAGTEAVTETRTDTQPEKETGADEGKKTGTKTGTGAETKPGSAEKPSGEAKAGSSSADPQQESSQTPQTQPSEDTSGKAASETKKNSSGSKKTTGRNVVKKAKQVILPDGKLVKTSKGYVYKIKGGGRLKEIWAEIKESVYYFDRKGYAKTGAFTWKGTHYYSDSKGRLLVDRFRTKGKQRWYYGADGAMVMGRWKTIRGKHYYFKASGEMARSEWIKGCWVKANGTFDYKKSRVKTGSFQAKAKQKLVLIGASRIRHIKMTVGSPKNVVYIAKAGEGYSWFVSEGLAELSKVLHGSPASKVVIQLGNNDLRSGAAGGNFEKYAALYRHLIKSYPKASFYFMDILPQKPLKCRQNKAARKFNARLKTEFSRHYIGGYDFLVKKGFAVSYNKVHYAPDTSRDIFNYILKKVNRR